MAIDADEMTGPEVSFDDVSVSTWEENIDAWLSDMPKNQSVYRYEFDRSAYPDGLDRLWPVLTEADLKELVKRYKKAKWEATSTAERRPNGRVTLILKQRVTR